MSLLVSLQGLPTASTLACWMHAPTPTSNSSSSYTSIFPHHCVHTLLRCRPQSLPMFMHRRLWQACLRNGLRGTIYPTMNS
jgi:hypothetical protein